jgi:CheY-like chemotaxis protein
VNQKLAVRLLEKDGHTVTVAGNGREALTALEQTAFDLVLMDVQMPEIGGFEATALIREREKKTGGHIPIVALTAHAMKGDQERCFEAGMDGYVSKPIQRKELVKAMEEILHLNQGRPKEAAKPDSTPEILNLDLLLARVDGDQDLLQELIEVFLEENPRMLQEVRDAVGRNDAERLKIAAHTLKGAVGNFGAEAPVTAAQQLEIMGKTGTLAQAPETLDRLEASLARLVPALEQLRTAAPVMQN